MEIELVWLRKFRASTGLYFIARYFPLGLVLFQIAATPDTPKVVKSFSAFISLAVLIKM